MFFNLTKNRRKSKIEENRNSVAKAKKVIERDYHTWNFKEINAKVKETQEKGKVFLTCNGILEKDANEALRKKYDVYLIESGEGNGGVPWFTIKVQ